MRIAQISFYADPERRAPEELLRAWPSLGVVARSAAQAGASVSVLQASQHTHSLTQDGVRYHFMPFGAACADPQPVADPRHRQEHGRVQPDHRRLGESSRPPLGQACRPQRERRPCRERNHRLPSHGTAGAGLAAFVAWPGRSSVARPRIERPRSALLRVPRTRKKAAAERLPILSATAAFVHALSPTPSSRAGSTPASHGDWQRDGDGPLAFAGYSRLRLCRSICRSASRGATIISRSRRQRAGAAIAPTVVYGSLVRASASAGGSV